MKSLRLYSILLEESSERAFSIDEIKIFNLLNREKQNLKSKGEITEYLKKVLGYLGYDKGDSMYYYYLYSLNYRSDGRYEEIKKGEEKSLSDIKAGKIANYTMSTFAKGKIPFKGNNVEGFWETDPKGVKQFVITSYGWYPIYIFKDKFWYQVSEPFSKSTSKQMGQTRIWGDNRYVLEPQQMNQLRNGVDINKIQDSIFDGFYDFLKSSYEGRNYIFITGTNPLRQFGYPTDKVRFKIRLDSIEKNDKIIFNLDVLEVAFLDIDGKIVTKQKPNVQDFEERMGKTLEEVLIRNLPYKFAKTAKEKLEINVNFVTE